MPSIRRPRLRALVVGTDPTTRAALLSYLHGAGIDADACGDAKGLERACRAPRSAADAVVVFPDDLAPAAVRATLRAARAVGRDVLLVVVTASPQRFSATAPLHVLPKPVFGWTLVDAIRAHAARSKEGVA